MEVGLHEIRYNVDVVESGAGLRFLQVENRDDILVVERLCFTDKVGETNLFSIQTELVDSLLIFLAQ